MEARQRKRRHQQRWVVEVLDQTLFFGFLMMLITKKQSLTPPYPLRKAVMYPPLAAAIGSAWRRRETWDPATPGPAATRNDLGCRREDECREPHTHASAGGHRTSCSTTATPQHLKGRKTMVTRRRRTDFDFLTRPVRRSGLSPVRQDSGFKFAPRHSRLPDD